MTDVSSNRFQDFFEDENYITLKNYLYNYLLRKDAINKLISKEISGRCLEVGVGSSPVVNINGNIIYSDLSHLALTTIKHTYGNGLYVVADVCFLPFKSDIFSCLICSEVLEHVENDSEALSEMARVMKPSGSLVITFPHRHCYYSFDDYFVKHLRRYELSEMQTLLGKTGLTVVLVQKVLGPLEKVTMIIVTTCIQGLQKLHLIKMKHQNKMGFLRIFIPIYKLINRFYSVIVRLDSRIMPLKLASVLLIKAIKKYSR